MSGSMAQSNTGKKQLVENQGESRQVEGNATEEFFPTSTTSATSTSNTTCATSATSVQFEVLPSPEPPASKEEIRLAILGHIRAIRALGRTEINTQEIADALNIPVQEVNNALEALKKHGVRRR
jgi:hypothetical protein